MEHGYMRVQMQCPEFGLQLDFGLVII